MILQQVFFCMFHDSTHVDVVEHFSIFFCSNNFAFSLRNVVSIILKESYYTEPRKMQHIIYFTCFLGQSNVQAEVVSLGFLFF